MKGDQLSHSYDTRKAKKKFMFKLSFKTWYFKLACFQHQSLKKIVLQTSVQQKKARRLDNVYYKHLIYSVGK